MTKAQKPAGQKHL